MCRRFFFRDMLFIFNTRVLNKGCNDSLIGKRYIVLLLFVCMIMWGASIFETNIKPTVTAMAEAKAQVIAIYAINDAINEEIVKKTDYNDIVTLKQDEQAKITALQVNVAKVNQMQALVSQLVQHKIENLDNSELKIPLGNLIHSSILAGWGPRIKIRIIPIGTVQSKFNGEFSNAGINQTRHKISLEIKGKISIMVPFISATKEVVTTIPVAETIIVGGVPVTYLDVSSATPEEQQKAREIAPNLATIGK